MADRKSELRLNNISFYFSSTEGFTVFGHKFEAKLKYDIEKPVDFWRAQLAFRGFSPPGKEVEVLKKRLKAANMEKPDEEVKHAAIKLILAHKTRSEESKKRKAGDNEAGDIRDNAKRALVHGRGLAEIARKRIIDRGTALSASQAKQLIIERYKEAQSNSGGQARRLPPVPLSRPLPATVEPQAPPRKERVINRRMAENNPEKFLRDAFFDENGKDLGYPPIELKNLCSADRAHLHEACDDLKLFHETTVTSVMVIGSGKNYQGQQRLTELNKAAGWPPVPLVPYVPDIDVEEEDEEDEDESEDTSEVEDQDDGGSELIAVAEEEGDQDWDITGRWEIKCPGMAGCFGQFAPYTVEIFSSQHRVGQQIHGRFDLGQYKGVFRFSSQQKSRMGNRCKDDIEEFLLPNEVPSAESPTIFYRWRGRESGENVIQLRSEFQLYEMTFSNGGSKVSGTWGCDADPGDVQFTGVKVGEHNAYDRMNIQHEWGHLNKQTYDQENRDRWRRGY